MNRFLKLQLIQVVWREINRIVNSKTLLFAAVLAPLGSLFLVTYIFSAGVVTHLPVTLIDNDNSKMSNALSRMVEATPIAKVAYGSNLDESRNDMNNGHCDAILIIPKDFERNILKGTPPQVALYINNSNVVKGGLIYNGLYKTLSTFAGGIKLNGNLLLGIPEQQALSNIQPIRIDSHLLFNPFVNYSYFLTLGLLPLMLVILVFLVTVFVLGTELKNATSLELLKTSGNSVFVALTGKMLPYTFLFMIHASIMNLILFNYLGTPLQGSIIVVLFSEFLLIVTYQMIAILFLSLTANMRLSLSLGSAYTMMALTFSGITFPTVALPLIAKLFSYIFPYTFWINIFLSQTIRNQPFFTTIPNFLILMLFIIISMFSFFTMKRKMTDSKYWGRS